MSNKPRRSSLRSLPTLVLIFALLGSASSAVAQSDADENGTVVPFSISVTVEDVIDAGRSWIDGEGLHVRDLITTSSVSGDLNGTAELVSDVDQFGPCSGPLDCEGDQEIFSEVRVESDEQIWSGRLALQFSDEPRSPVHGILVGRHGTGDQVIVLDSLLAVEGDTIELGGSMVTLSGPTSGVHLTGSACSTSPTTADGGFIGTTGLIVDSGPLRVSREPIGGSAPTGVYGELRQIGQKGSLRGIFIAGVNGQHLHGSFVLVGESGPYRGVIGYGRATATVTEDSRCDSGLLVTSTWTGPANFLIDPDTFLAPKVFITSPADGSTVGSPFVLEFDAENVVIEPAGQARDGAGHYTIILDAPCIGPGEPIPDDDAHFQLVDGASTVNLAVFAGEHRLCLQLTDGNGIAQPATDVITVFVAASGGEALGQSFE